MNSKRFHMVALLALFFFSVQQTAFAQFPLFAGPADQDYCLTSGAAVNFDAFYVNDSPPLAPTDFTFNSSDITIMLTAPGLGSGSTFSTTATGASGALYELIITSSGNDYTVRLAILSGITPTISGTQYTCVASDMVPTTSSPGQLTVVTPISISIVSPVTLMATVCEGETVLIDASTSAIPDSYAWIKDGTTTVGTAEDLSLTMTSTGDSGSYQLTVSDAGCPDITSNPVTVLVVPNATLMDTDMAAKELAPGDTKSFTVTADNVDGSTTYTWTIDGNSFTAAMLPATIMVNGNTIQINSISNVGVGLSTVASTLSMSNISMSGVPDYTADVSLTISNNSACVATTMTVLSNTTTIFPVEWTYFNATNEDNKAVSLEWETATETNNDRFIIERSEDGKKFIEIGQISGAGTTFNVSKYNWMDKNLPNTQALLYRLRQIDFDGAESFSEIRVVQMKRNNSISISVASFNSESSSIQIESSIEGTANMQIFDARGVLVLQKELYVAEGSQVTNFTLPQVRGIYFLRLQLGAQEVTTSFVK